MYNVIKKKKKKFRLISYSFKHSFLASSNNISAEEIDGNRWQISLLFHLRKQNATLMHTKCYE
jgi:hypothetical protein